MAKENQYILNIENVNDALLGSILETGSQLTHYIENIDILPSSKVAGADFNFEQIINFFDVGDQGFLREYLDESLQLNIGSKLFSETFGKHSDKFDTSRPAHVLIVSEDEFILRLPWVLSAFNGFFLSKAGWSFSIGMRDILEQTELPPSPRILVLAPEPVTQAPTGRDGHIAALRRLVEHHDDQYRSDTHFRAVFTWEQFQGSLQHFKPDVFYFYGHGIGDADRMRLVLENTTSEAEDVPAIDVSHQLQRAGIQASICYINCCMGASGGLLGAGHQFLQATPAVVTNSLVAFSRTAQSQALEFWQEVLVLGSTPESAISKVYARSADFGLTTKDARWMTPILFRGYANWLSNPLQVKLNYPHDPHWGVRLDRLPQTGQAYYQVKRMLRECDPSTLVYIWYGKQGQGVDTFYDRLTVELQADAQSKFVELRLWWPDTCDHLDRSFEEILLSCLEINDLSYVPASLRAKAAGGENEGLLVLVRFSSLDHTSVIKPSSIRLFLEWWDMTVTPQLKESGVYAVIGIPFIVTLPNKFREIHVEAFLNLTHLSETRVQVLQEFGHVVKSDLRQLIEISRLPIPQSKRENVIDLVLENSRGVYEATIMQLGVEIEKGWTSDKLIDENTNHDQADDIY